MAKPSVSPADVVEDARIRFSERVQDAFRELLETKHLYQRVHVSTDNVPDGDLLSRVPGIRSLSAPATSPSSEERRATTGATVRNAVLSAVWIVTNPSRTSSREVPPAASDGTSFLGVRIPDVRLFCGTCGRHEAFNLVSAVDTLAAALHYQYKAFGSGTAMTQVFHLVYECQACKRIPEVFLVRRAGVKLIQSGRSPMEVLEVPRVIPQQIRDYYRGALLAFNSGQTLAANFLLRVVIEQWARSATGLTGTKADETLDSYVEGLPGDFKSRFPALKSQYTYLSQDIHEATGNAETFLRVRSEVDKHFEARGLFDLGSSVQSTAESQE